MQTTTNKKAQAHNANLPFPKLPAELRNHIYEYILFDLGRGYFALKKTLTIPAICRQIQNEMEPLLRRKKARIEREAQKVEEDWKTQWECYEL